MKTFIPVYLLVFLLGTVVIDLYFPAMMPHANAQESPVHFELPTALGGKAEIPTPKLTSATGFDFTKLPPLPENLKASGRCHAWGLALTGITTPAGELPGGTFLEYPDINATPLNAWYFANGQWNGLTAVPPEKVNFFGGTLDEAEPEHLRLLQRYYFLRGQLDKPQTAAVAAVAPAVNPYLEDYKKISKQYLDFQERSKTLTAQRDAARGTTRDKLITELRLMKQDEPVLAKKLEAIKAQYNDWKAKNPAPAAPAATPNNADSPETLGIRNELKRLEPEVKRVVN